MSEQVRPKYNFPKASAKDIAKLFDLSRWQIERVLEKHLVPVNLGEYGLGRGKQRLWHLSDAITIIKQVLAEGGFNVRKRADQIPSTESDET